MIKSMNELNSLGALKALLSPHINSDELNAALHRFPKQAIVGLGQGGGRMAAELSRFGFPTFLLNSSVSDMNEYEKLIPEERRIETKSQEFPHLEGTDKDAQLGYQIAIENKAKYVQVATEDEVQDAEFVWVCVSLGGGTGNGALPVALNYLSQVRKNSALPGGKIPLGVICSLPSIDEKGSAFRKNALAGINLLEKYIKEEKIGSVLVIDNQKISDYYNNAPLITSQGTQIDARSYSNMIVASSLFEVGILPLLRGRVVLDKTELLSTWATPGWLSISKRTVAEDAFEQINFDTEITSLFKDNEVLAKYDFERAITGATAIIYPDGKHLSPKIADEVYKYASDLLGSKVNHGVYTSRQIKNILLYGLAVVNEPPVRLEELKSEKSEWERIEKAQVEARKQASSGLDEFDDFFKVNTLSESRKTRLSAEDLLGDEPQVNKPKRVSALELSDDFLND
jgi:tubulin-like protein CetZ